MHEYALVFRIVMACRHLLALVMLCLELATTLPLHTNGEDINPQCPLNGLTELNYDTHCFDEKPEENTSVTVYNKTLPFCCMELLKGCFRILIQYTNSSGNLLLNKTQEQACFGMLSNTTECGPIAQSFTEGASPCTFGRVDDLATALQNLGRPNLSLESVIQDCTGPRQDITSLDCLPCTSSFTNAVVALAQSLKDDPFICAGALILGLASSRANDTLWLQSVSGCMESVIEVNEPAAQGKETDHLDTGILIVKAVAAALAVVGMAALIFYAKKHLDAFKDADIPHKQNLPKGGMHLESSYSETYDNIQSIGLYTFSAHEIIKATNNFSQENFIGQGNAGKVYKGVLPSGQLVAVKKIDKNKQLDTFKTELINLSKVRHAHLVALMGYCHCNYGDEHFLVYEYCSNGNLSEWLFSNSDGRVLTWQQRLKIAVNSARGLWFLHNYPGGSIVHRDIKPTNILLNEYFEAKLSDFGLAKYIAMEDSTVLTEVKGTAGYMDPEYMSMGELTQASDVYSFGVVLLELISGHRAIDPYPKSNLSLVNMAKRLAYERRNMEGFVDPRLQGEYSMEVLEKVFHMAILCTSSSRTYRVTMKDVLTHLDYASYISSYTDEDTHADISPLTL